jgi:hypothetical protein
MAFSATPSSKISLIKSCVTGSSAHGAVSKRGATPPLAVAGVVAFVDGPLPPCATAVLALQSCRMTRSYLPGFFANDSRRVFHSLPVLDLNCLQNVLMASFFGHGPLTWVAPVSPTRPYLTLRVFDRLRCVSEAQCVPHTPPVSPTRLCLILRVFANAKMTVSIAYRHEKELTQRAAQHFTHSARVTCSGYTCNESHQSNDWAQHHVMFTLALMLTNRGGTTK